MRTCLVVDDSSVIRKVARSILETLHFEVSEADGGQEAIAHCKARTPDIVLLDWAMPGMAGLEVLGALRLANLKRKPYVIYCTTENDPTELTRAFAAGADDYVLKPYDRESLTAKLTDIAAA